MVAGKPGQMTLRDWLIHYSPKRDRVWPSVVEQFYKRAAANPDIADYFVDVDMPRLQGHFVRALMLLTGQGLTSTMVKRLQEAHASVTNSRGQAIRPEIYDAVVHTLVGVLTDEGVSAPAIAQLARTIEPLRGVIVRTPGVGTPAMFSA